jgi:hypothetical protein
MIDLSVEKKVSRWSCDSLYVKVLYLGFCAGYKFWQ